MNALTATQLDIANTQSPAPRMTLAEAQKTLETWSDLAPRRAEKMRTALATAARALAPNESRKAAASAVSMDCTTLSQLLKVPAATLGMTASRRTSLCSELRYVMRRLGLHEPDTRGTPILDPVLQACLEVLPEYRRLAMLDFLRFLEAREVAPDKVDGDTLVAYQVRCAQHTLCADPVERVRQVAAAWNWARQHVADWPGQAVTQLDRTNRYSFPLATYPLSFQQDLDQYTSRLANEDIDFIFSGDIFNADGRPMRRAQRPLRPASISAKRWIIRCAAAALVLKGVPQEQIRTLRDLVDPLDHPERIIRFFLERRSNQRSPMADKVGQTLHLLARDHCGVLEAQVERIADWAARVEMPEPKGLTDKNTRRLRALMQPRARAMLLWFPRELMRRAADPTLQPHAAARLAMYATAMELLLVCPMRRGNLAGLRLDRHLHQPDPRRQRRTHIFINAGEVKNEFTISWPLPSESQKLLETYVTQHRWHLVNPGNPYLFGIDDRQRAAQNLGEWLSQAVTEAIGVEFNAHLARHFAAWNFLRLNPGQYEVVRQVLGHHSIEVTMKYYVGLEADSAAEHFDRTVLRDRQALRSIAAHAFRKGAGGLSYLSSKGRSSRR